ncbi:MAG TPA: hypothetical protein VIM81_05415 [Gammaproteobacteria bacterium]
MRRRNGHIASAALRERLAQESARIMIEHGIVDFRLAKRKAAERLAVTSIGALPSNAQIEQCLAERQRIFEPLAHGARLGDMRRVAARVMAMLADFEPRLVGPVLAGTATSNTAIELHVFSDTPEAVAQVLAASNVACGECERRCRYSGGKAAMVPGFTLVEDLQRVVILVFTENGLREAPLSPVDGRPMQRASRAKVATLVDL